MRGGKAAGAGAGVAVAAVLVCTVVVPLGAAAPQGGVPVPPDVQAAQALISLAYPELRDRSLTLHFTAADGGLRVRVAEAVNPVSAPAGVVVPDLVEATVQLGADGRLVRFRAEGVLVASAARRALALALRAHPQWTEAERQARLMALGARQVPPGRFDARLDLARWARFLGASALISAAAFQWGASAPPDNSPPGPTWVASLTAASGDGRTLRYRVEFEPLGGRLVALTRE